MQDNERQGVSTAECGPECGCDEVIGKPLRSLPVLSSNPPVYPEVVVPPLVAPPLVAPPSTKQAFNVAADTTLGRCQEIHSQRGAAYQDTWDLANVHAPVLRLALRETFGFNATAEELRIIMAASLCDVKDSRLIGKWNIDNIDDGINYRAAFAYWMQEYMDAHGETPLS